MGKSTENYYLKNAKKTFKYFNFMSKSMEEVLLKRYSDYEVESLLAKAREEFIKLAPTIPYIGGYENSGTKNILGAGVMLSYINVLEDYGLEEREIGKILFEMLDKLFKEKSDFSKVIIKFFATRKIGKKFIAKQVEKSMQYEKYPDAWENRILDVEGYDISFNLNRCGICTYYKSQAKENYIKYICLGDFPIFNAIGMKLERPSTIASGGDTCAYRLTFSDEKVEAWPPEGLAEWKYD